MMDQIAQERNIVADLANQVALERIIVTNLADKMEQQAKSVIADRAEITVMKRQVLEEKMNINNAALKIKKEANKFSLVETEAEIRLGDQSQAITVTIGKVEAQMTATQKMINMSATIVK